MTRIHDMGGRFGDGPIKRDADDAPIFPEDWHAKALAITLAAGALGQWNLDVSRHSRERLSPKDYSRFSYYEKWISALAGLLVEKGIVTAEELRTGQSDGLSDLADRCMQPDVVAKVLRSGGPVDRAGEPPKFALGDEVTTTLPAANARVQGGHTRLPAYAAGMTGRIVAVHGCHVFPDSNAHGFGEDPQPLYSVAFSAADLWGGSENAQDEVVLDLWEPYLKAHNG